ncbi:oxidase cueO precursor [Zopfia rhizophila CBS 207.26]|uniref:Oxidase cueO n=1 Tax=Zopfia rhizophila CBS 207.26 TaxID=1314779 RepID=A0A6A6E994_9PEZI|nr:oxidase cueO precursor [Zopfia rhizophila CBS 207.26]
MTRFRSFFVASLLACQALAGDDEWLSPVYKDFYQFPLPIPPVKTPKTSYVNKTTGDVIDYYEIEIKPFEQQVYPGLKKARLVGYDGMSPGPTFKLEKGRESVVRFINHGDKETSVHLHGSYSRAPFDGWAEDTTKVGQYKDYYYPNKQNARTLWYHDHAVHITAENAYFGQAGFYILHDAAEDSLNLPAGDYDVPLALASKQYNKDGTLFSPAGETDSLFGDVIHVNGQPWPYFKVEPRKYRLRFLDTSVSRAFKLYFEADGALGKKIPFDVIASDAGLMTKPVQSDNLEISMAERWEVIFDFTQYAGKNVTVRNNRDVQHDEDYNSTDKVMRFVVGKEVKSQQGNGNLPGSLRSVPFPPSKSGVDRSFKFHRSNGEWQVNGVTFADVKNRILAKPPRGQVEIWELENSSGGWSHPIHVHLVDFQILSRSGGKRPVLGYEKEALKDVVLLGEGETARVIARFAPWDGVYMFHCHNLIHEDHDMMAASNVTSLGDWGYPETTSFIDPMEERYRPRDEKSADFTEQAIQARLNELYVLDAYKNPDKVEQALISYRANGGPSQTTFATSVTSAAASGATTTKASAAASTTPEATLTTATKSDDKKITTTR